MLANPRRLARFVLTGLLLAVAVLAVVRAHVQPRTVLSSPIGLSALSREPIQVVRFTLYDAGIYPTEARVKRGRAVISLVDYTGGVSGLILERETGNRERAGDIKAHGKTWRGRQEFNLSPGNYVVFDARNTSARAKLIVEP